MLNEEIMKEVYEDPPKKTLGEKVTWLHVYLRESVLHLTKKLLNKR